MAVIVLNWELGADLGHIGRFLPLALRLREQGHRPVMLLRDITRANAVLGPNGLEFLQAPVWMTPVAGLPPDLNFTETLFRFGFLHPEGLLSMCKAWRSLWAMLKPDLMLFDHAPTALLAARGLGIPRMALGNSFAVPPREKPLPRYRWWIEGSADRARMAETETRTVRNANTVLEQLGAPLLQQVSDLYDVESTLVCSHPEMDVYGQRDPSMYVGPINNIDNGAEPVWPAGDGLSVFAYLKPSFRHFEQVLAAMHQNTLARFVVFAPGMPELLRQRYASARLSFTDTPLRMRTVTEQCDAVICHAGGVTDVALNAGKPVLLLPTQMEQVMTSQRVAALGAGVFLPIESPPEMLKKLLHALLTDARLRDKAQQYAQRPVARTQESGLNALLDGCCTLLKPRAATTSTI